MLSVNLFRVGQAREPGDRIELPQQPADQLIGAIPCAKLLETTEHSREGVVRFGDGSLREVVLLLRQQLAMPEEFLTIEIGR